MAKNASVLDPTPADSPNVRLLKPAVESDAHHHALMDLSVGDGERQALVHSQHHARIRIQLAPEGEVLSHPNLLVYIANHLKGRCPYPTVENGNILDILYYVAGNSGASNTKVRDFAENVTRILGLSSDDIVSAGIEAIDQQIRTNILAVVGVEPPGLRLV